MIAKNRRSADEQQNEMIERPIRCQKFSENIEFSSCFHVCANMIEVSHEFSALEKQQYYLRLLNKFTKKK